MNDQTCEFCGQILDVDGSCSACQGEAGETFISESKCGNEGDASTSIPQGNRFGDYELLEEIGRGGMGVIYKARHVTLNRITALKMMLSGQYSSAQERQRFQIEAEAAAKLDHPGIVPIYEIGEVDGRAFFAMKFLEGGSLENRIEEFRSDIRKAVSMLATSARAVHHAHQRGILHRDLKPANILLDENDQPLVTDLGLAKNTNNLSDVTNTGAILGTPSYMPPEQAAALPQVTTAVDVYSLGAILYELLTGVPPFRGTNALETLLAVREGVVERPRRKNPSVDPDLELICLKCLATNPADRYETALALAQDLEAWQQNERLSVRPPRLSALAMQWLRQHRQQAYIGFTILMGVLVTVPFALDFAMGQNYGDVYNRFPESERPYLFSFGRIPSWLQFTLSGILVFVLWPSLGMLNAVMSRPTTWFQSLKAGTFTAFLLMAMFSFLLGWMPFLRLINDGQRITVLTSAIWPPNGKDPEERRELANELFTGLNDIPVEQRADVVARRLTSDRMAAAPGALVMVLLVEFLLMVPVIYGTLIAGTLIARQQSMWLIYLRYFLAWWLAGIGWIMTVDAVFSDFASQSSERYPQAFVQLLIAAIAVTICWLITKRWRTVDQSNVLQ